MNFVFLHAFEIILLAILAFAINKLLGRRFDLFSPLTVVNLTFVLYYAVRPIYLMSIDDAGVFASLNPAQPADYAWATGYALLGLFCFNMGYLLRNDPPDKKRVIFWSRPRVSRVAVLGGMVAFASVALGIVAAGGISGLLSSVGRLREVTAGWGYATLGTCFFPIVTILLLVDHLLGKPHRFRIAVFGALSVGWCAMMGNRTGMFALVISCVATVVYIKGIKSWPRFIFKSVLVGLVLIPMILFWSVVREIHADVTDIPAMASYALDQQSDRLASVALGEFSAVDSFAAVLHGGPSVFPFRYGQTYLDVIRFVVPRSLWPDKPKAFSTAVGDYVTEDGNDVPPGVIGELYVNFHVLGIVFGMFFLGRLMVSLHRNLLRSYGGIALYALLLPYFGVFLSRNFLGGGVLLLTTVLPMWPAVRWVQQRSPKNQCTQ